MLGIHRLPGWIWLNVEILLPITNLDLKPYIETTNKNSEADGSRPYRELRKIHGILPQQSSGQFISLKCMPHLNF